MLDRASHKEADDAILLFDEPFYEKGQSSGGESTGCRPKDYYISFRTKDFYYSEDITPELIPLRSPNAFMLINNHMLINNQKIPLLTQEITLQKEEDASIVSPVEIEVNEPLENDEKKRRQLLSKTFKILQEIFYEYSVAGWDGYDAQPISEDSFKETIRFLQMLPFAMPIPEVVPEPSGQIALEWYESQDYIFVVSLSGKKLIDYAGLFGEGNKTYGTERFKKTIPNTIIENVNRLYVHGD
jgi:hypothetical protein